MEKKYVDANHKQMAYGYTTGTCSAAAAKACVYRALAKEVLHQIPIDTPKGWRLMLDVYQQEALDIKQLDLSWFGEEEIVICAVRKDAGDDPDVTNGILVYATISCEAYEVAQKDKCTEVIIEGGTGVGRVTMPGLNQPIGAPAINEVPRKMITQAVLEACEELDFVGSVKVLISIPEGVEIAKKTFNERLGIVGGISVLGTSGIVEPMSKQALLDTIRVELKVQKEKGTKHLIIAPGNMGMDFMRNTYHYDLDQAVKCSNFVGETLDMAVEMGFRSIVFVGNIGKAVKLAGGIMNTHSKEADCRMEILASLSLLAGATGEEAREILQSLTTEDVLSKMKEKAWFADMLKLLLEKITFYLQNRVGKEVAVGALTFSSVLGELGCSDYARKVLQEMTKKGVLYGVGVGPGDPELLTIKAMKRIQDAEVVAVPAKQKEDSVAYQIVLQILPELKQKECLCIDMPMTKDKERLCKAHKEGVDRIMQVLQSGKDVVFLTLGDPTIYATYMYLHKGVKEAGYQAMMINGVPSFCAVAASLDISLAEQSEQLHIIPASYDIEKAFDYPGNKIFMKAGKKLPYLKEKLIEQNQGGDIYMVENCGMDGEKHYHGAENIPENAGYYSIVLVKNNCKEI